MEIKKNTQRELSHSHSNAISLANAYSWLEINKTAFEHNVAQYKKIIGSNVLALIIKSNAYGHGILEIAQLAEHSIHVDWLCVSNLSSALFLRNHRITKPLLVLGCMDVDPTLAVHKNIDFVIDDLETAHQLNTIGIKHAYVFKVHIKVDTGLSRLGVYKQALLPFITQLQRLPYIAINGIMSHFAQSQKEDQQYTIEQYNHFATALEKLKQHNISIPYTHMSNSAATSALALPTCNFFRVGVGAFGFWPSEFIKQKTLTLFPSFNLQPVLTWKTKIIKIKKIPENTFVSYDCLFKTQRSTTIGILNVGYYDGYDTRLSNKAYVLVNNTLAPILGRVCMNLTIIDLTDVPTAHVNDEVTLLGKEKGVTIYDMAHAGNIRNVRELVTRINPHLPRVITP